MLAHRLNPILNVSDMQASFAWFAKFGWEKAWDWGEPPTFGAVKSGVCEIFLCLDGQGGRGANAGRRTFGPDGDADEKGVWISIWVHDVDAVYRQCVAAGLDIAFPPADMPWSAREMHVRHPDGHVFRVSQGLEEE
jgi:catechol 2,3-dioxygenase-like lactoylglutathione lyase family enzyme